MNLQLIADYACQCGESPVWHPLEKRLYWTDIDTGRLFRYDPASGLHEQTYHGQRVGGFAIQADGSLLLFREKGNVVLWKDGQVVQTIVPSIPGQEQARFNDVIADPEGRVFCGTLADLTNPNRLYRLDRDGTVTMLLDNVRCPNGMGFTPDLKRMYFTDSLLFTIYVLDYDRATGSLSNQRVFVKSPEKEGYPDGLTVDADGDVWSARWDGGMIVRFDPTGKEKERLTFPTGKISSCMFGGDDLRDLYVTTAGGENKTANGPTAGALYRCRPGPQGRPEFLSRIGL